MIGEVFMERIALQKLINWNNNKRKKPLIIWGARQVGKTYLVEELLPKLIIKITTSMLIAKKRMKFVSFVLKPPMQRKLLNIFRCVKGSK